jgi:GT2 family glycosyltransferase
VTTSILLISTDRAGDLRWSLPAAMAQDGAEVVVVDNASGDETGELARAHGARHLRLERRMTWCEANDAAISATEGELVLLLNADCFLAPDFLERARPRLEEEGVGAVAPKLLRAAGGAPDQRLDEVDAAGMAVDRRRKNALVGHGEPASRYSTPGDAFGADGAAALFRRAMLEDCRVEGRVLDPAFEKYAADVDLAWRAQLLGWRCAYEPAAVAWHVRSYGPSTRATVPAADRRAQFRNRYLAIAKNDTPGALARDLPRLLAYEVLALGYALLRERELLSAYRDAWRRLPAARRQRREIQSRRRAARVPLGLAPRP